MSTRNTSGGKGGRCERLTTSPPSCVEYHEIWETKPPGTLWACYGIPLFLSYAIFGLFPSYLWKYNKLGFDV
jgi:hypothetical protein